MDEKNVPGVAAGKAAEESSSKAPEQLTPREWAQRLNLIFKPNARIANALRAAQSTSGTNMPQTEGRLHWTFAAADKLFGWSDHAYHYEQDPKAPKFILTKDQFVRALKVAADFPAHKELPQEAIPKSQMDGLKKYEPKRSAPSDEKSTSV